MNTTPDTRDAERAYALLADLCDSSEVLVDGDALAVAEAFNTVAELARPEQLVTREQTTIGALITEAFNLLGQLAASAETPHTAFRYASAHLQLQDLARRRGIDAH